MKQSATRKGPGPIIVTGDVTIDWMEISIPPVDPRGAQDGIVRNWQLVAGTRWVTLPGGALLTARLVRAATGATVLSPHIANLQGTSPEQVIHSVVSVDRFPVKVGERRKGEHTYRISLSKGFAGPAAQTPPPLKVDQDDPDAGIVVLDDACNGFREAPEAWPAALRGGKRPLVVLKMSRPVGQGKLWETLMKDHAERLVVVVSADDLRQDSVQISRRLSWERTATDFVWQLSGNPELRGLARCHHLVVRLGQDGAVYHSRPRGKGVSRLYYDPSSGEGGFLDECPGIMFGLNSAFVAAITARLARDGLKGVGEGVREGIQAARRLCLLGFGRDVARLDYPDAKVFRAVAEEGVIADAVIPGPESQETADPRFWCILREVARPVEMEAVAARVVIEGPDKALDKVPVGRFGGLRTVDRHEIENYRSIQSLIREHLEKETGERILSIGVFGPPGSGKSYGVTQVARAVAGNRLAELLFNLSQMSSPNDLVAAFHRIRDVRLGGKIPFVFFDEFDTPLGGRLGWLRHFLAPMQDGVFREGEAVHPIGRAIFVFAGGTSPTLEGFCGATTAAAPAKDAGDSRPREAPAQEFRDAKGPDFVSRLRGFVNVLGPDPKGGEQDVFYMVRRAIVMRSLLERKAPGLMGADGCLRIDPGVLRAMLRVPRYKHGMRSIEALVEMSALAGRRSFEQSALPSREQLDLHVDAEAFLRLVVREVFLGSARESIAREIHEEYRRNQKGKKADDPSMAPWDRLEESLQKSNRRQADHIPVKLKAIGCDFRPVRGGTAADFAFGAEELERLSEMEHERWVAERTEDGWVLGARKDVKRKVSPHLVPWSDLSDDVRAWDRDAVKATPALLARAGFGIYRGF